MLNKLLLTLGGKSEILALLIASRHASVPSSWGIFVYKLETSMATRMDSGGNLLDFNMAVRWLESLI